MKLYRKAETRDIDHLAIQLKQANGNIKNHLPHSFENILKFSFGDIFVSDQIFALLNFEVYQDIDSCLHSVLTEDYGIIDNEMKDTNCENRYLGNGKGIVGRYEIGIGSIEISILDTYTYIDFLPKDL